MSKKHIMESLKKSLGDTLNEDVASEIAGHIDQLVSDRSAASSLKLSEQVKKLTATNKQLSRTVQTQQKEFKEEAQKFARDLAVGFAKKESILFEELNNYKQEAVQVISEVSEEYRNVIQEMVIQEANEYKGELEETMLSEAKQFRFKQEAALAEDVKAYQTDVLEKLDQFLEAEVTANIPKGIMEAAGKTQALEEIVEGVMTVFSEKSIQLDESSEKVLKDAKSEYSNLSESYNAKVKEAVSLTAKVRELEKDVKLTSLTEGMTAPQKKNVRKLLESASVGDVERRFETVKDLVIKESVGSRRKPTRVNKVAQTQPSKQATRQVEILEESIRNPIETKKPAPEVVEMDTWRKSLDRLQRRIQY